MGLPLPNTGVPQVPTLDGMSLENKTGEAKPGGLQKRGLDAFRGLEAYRSAAVQVHAKSHSYLMGLQHRRQNDGVYWHPDIPSTAYVYQNAGGRVQWPVRATFSDQLRRAWDWRGK